MRPRAAPLVLRKDELCACGGCPRRQVLIVDREESSLSRLRGEQGRRLPGECPLRRDISLARWHIRERDGEITVRSHEAVPRVLRPQFRHKYYKGQQEENNSPEVLSSAMF